MFNKVQTLVTICNSGDLVVTMLDTLKCWVADMFLVLLSEEGSSFEQQSSWHGTVLENVGYNLGSFIYSMAISRNLFQMATPG